MWHYPWDVKFNVICTSKPALGKTLKLSWEVFLTQHGKSEIRLWKQGSIKVGRHHEWVQRSCDTYHIGQGRAWYFPPIVIICTISEYSFIQTNLNFISYWARRNKSSSSSYPMRYVIIYIYILIINTSLNKMMMSIIREW